MVEKKEIENYIRQCIHDIIEKHKCSCDEVMSILSEFVPCELKELCETTDKERFTVVTWPDSQNLMELEGFEENSFLVNDNKGMDKYGSSAYFVRISWLNSHNF